VSAPVGRSHLSHSRQIDRQTDTQRGGWPSVFALTDRGLCIRGSTRRHHPSSLLLPPVAVVMMMRTLARRCLAAPQVRFPHTHTHRQTDGLATGRRLTLTIGACPLYACDQRVASRVSSGPSVAAARFLAAPTSLRLSSVAGVNASPAVSSPAGAQRNYVEWSTSSNNLSSWTEHESLRAWVLDRIRMLQPARVHLCDGSEQENQEMLTSMVHNGSLIPVNPKIRPNSYVARSTTSDGQAHRQYNTYDQRPHPFTQKSAPPRPELFIRCLTMIGLTVEGHGFRT
jgi:hypothetical protein